MSLGRQIGFSTGFISWFCTTYCGVAWQSQVSQVVSLEASMWLELHKFLLLHFSSDTSYTSYQILGWPWIQQQLHRRTWFFRQEAIVSFLSVILRTKSWDFESCLISLSAAGWCFSACVQFRCAALNQGNEPWLLAVIYMYTHTDVSHECICLQHRCSHLHVFVGNSSDVFQ